jgi:hypothetical protein
VSYIQELRDVIRRVHGVESEHVSTIPVKEVFEGRTVWDGFVEMFELKGHPTAQHVYAWGHDTDDPQRPRRHVTVLRLGKIETPLDAVRAAIVQEFRESNAAEES